MNCPMCRFFVVFYMLSIFELQHYIFGTKVYEI